MSDNGYRFWCAYFEMTLRITAKQALHNMFHQKAECTVGEGVGEAVLSGCIKVMPKVTPRWQHLLI